MKAVGAGVEAQRFAQEFLAAFDVPGRGIDQPGVVADVCILDSTSQGHLHFALAFNKISGAINGPGQRLVSERSRAQREILASPSDRLRAVLARVGEKAGEVMEKMDFAAVNRGEIASQRLVVPLLCLLGFV